MAVRDIKIKESVVFVVVLRYMLVQVVVIGLLIIYVAKADRVLAETAVKKHMTNIIQRLQKMSNRKVG